MNKELKEKAIDIKGNTKNNHKKHWDTRGRTGTVGKNGYLAHSINSERYYDHRKKMETILNRKLDENEIVHHKDGNRLNNLPENLIVLTRSEHARLHAKQNGLGIDRKGISPTNKLSDKLIKRIAVLRNKYKKSLSQISTIMGISYPTVQKYCFQLNINKIGLTRWTNH